jgi:N-methylhydantoinase A
MGELINRKNLLTFDMGGTSCDTSAIVNGDAQEVSERDAGGMPILGPFIQIVTIGAGGGSIARVNEVGELLVGPESAGSEPGPACYQRGGTEPTVTDANLALGFLNPGAFEKIHLSPKNALKAVDEKIAKPLNMKIEEAAFAIRTVIDSKLAGAINLVSVEKGLDPSDFSLIAYGAAGPLEASNIAEDMGIKEVIIPRYPGVFSALGMLLTDYKYNYLQTVYLDFKDEPFEDINHVFEILESKARNDIQRGQDIIDKVLIRSLDMRFAKQSYMLNIPVGNGIFDIETLSITGQNFMANHEELYGFIDEIEKIKIVNVRLTALGRLKRPTMSKYVDKKNTMDFVDKAKKGTRRVSALEVEAEVYDRDKLTVGARLEGPVILEAKDTTVWIPSKYVGEIDHFENLIMKKC